MLRQQAQVREFHEAFGVPVRTTPQLPEWKERMLRVDLINEELSELSDALMVDGSLVKTADALGDLLYVVLGAAETFGIDLEPIFDEIHRSNMTKTGGRRSHSGKILKGPNYEPPELLPILVKQGMKDPDQDVWDYLDGKDAVQKP